MNRLVATLVLVASVLASGGPPTPWNVHEREVR